MRHGIFRRDGTVCLDEDGQLVEVCALADAGVGLRELEIPEENIWTSALATAQFLKDKLPLVRTLWVEEPSTDLMNGDVDIARVFFG